MQMLACDVAATVKEFLAVEQKVKFAYLFGSTARNATGPLSDLDVAVYLDGRVDFFTTRLLLMESLAKRLGTEKFDLVVLNNAPVVLKFEAVKNGRLLKEDHPRRVLFETRVLREYLDSAYLRQVQNAYLKDSLQRRDVHG
jgi:predicted nucleotidyltransferase